MLTILCKLVMNLIALNNGFHLLLAMHKGTCSVIGKGYIFYKESFSCPYIDSDFQNKTYS